MVKRFIKSYKNTLKEIRSKNMQSPSKPHHKKCLLINKYIAF